MRKIYKERYGLIVKCKRPDKEMELPCRLKLIGVVDTGQYPYHSKKGFQRLFGVENGRFPTGRSGYRGGTRF